MSLMTVSKILQEICRKISDGTGGVLPVLANIATVNDDDASFDKSSIIFSIVNIEEDKTLKNQSLYKKGIVNVNNIDSKEKYKKPAQNLIFSILFSSYTKNTEQYSDGISKLEQVIRYLQNNNVFYFDDNDLYEQTEIPSEVSPDLFHKLILDLTSLKMEQLNQMWSYLNNKYMPSVLYTMRLIRIQNEDVENVPVITNVKTEVVQKSIE